MLKGAFVVLFVFWAASAEATTYYVNVDTGDDSRSNATAQNANTPWQSLYRPLLGCAMASAPCSNSGNAATAGDTVQVSSGTYSTSLLVGDWKVPVYNPVNQGTIGNPLSIVCAGTCRLAAPSANGPVAGAYQRNYIRWYANDQAGHSWRITANGDSITGANNAAADTDTDTKSDPLVVNTKADTGPVVLWDSTGGTIEGFYIDGDHQINYTDNWDGIRIEEAPSSTARNNYITTFRNQSNTGNGTGIKLYASPDSIVENNTITNCGSGVALKDAPTTVHTNENIRVRNNKITCDRAISMSQTSEGRNYFYRNIGIGTGTNGAEGLKAIDITGGGPTNDWFFNNTFVGFKSTNGGVGLELANGSGTGGRAWNNIFYDMRYMVFNDTAIWPAATVWSLEHNVYRTQSVAFSGDTSGDRATMALFNDAYTDQNIASPLSIVSDPLFANAAAGDYRLCTGSGAPHASCSGASPALALGVDIDDLDGDASTTDNIPAGAFLTNLECIGRTSDCSSTTTVRRFPRRPN